MRKLLIFMSALMFFMLACGKNETMTSGSTASSEKKASSEKTAGTEAAPEKIKEFELKTLDGKTQKSSEIFKNGKPTLFLVVAEWCPHCREESPDIQKFYDEYKEKVNIVVVYTSYQSNLDEVKKYVELNEYTFPAYYDENGAVLEMFKVEGFPSNFKIVDGKIEKKFEVKVDYDVLVEEFGK